MTTIADIHQIRAEEPGRIAAALRARPRGAVPAGKLLAIAADHPARGALAAGQDRMAMADRAELLDRCVTALSRPAVHGFLGTADLIEELTLLGALDGKVVFGSMNRGGLAGASFEIDDRYTGYDARGVVDAGLDGGKLLLRLDLDDPATAGALEGAARAVDTLGEHRLIAMVEPFLVTRSGGRVVNDLSTDAVVRSVAIASGLGRTSAYTWLKLPCVPGMERVAAASTMPTLILGGEVAEDPGAKEAAWAHALTLPGVKGLMVGRSLLFPPDGDVGRAVDRAAALL
jgi:hypothetical protein